MYLLKSTLPVTIVPKSPEDGVGVEDRGRVAAGRTLRAQVRIASSRIQFIFLKMPGSHLSCMGHGNKEAHAESCCP